MNKTDRFRQSPSTTGTFLSSGAAVATEIATQFPFAWILLDMEHGGIAAHSIADHLRAFAGKEVAAIVRVPSIDPVLIGKVLDEGADGIMLPHATSAEHVKACVAAMYYSPKGRRGFSSSTRQYNYGMNVPADVTAANKPLLFAQIEDVEGVHNANEIAAVAEVDVLFVGPADLKLALKHNAAADLSFETSLEMVAAAAAANNKKAGILVRDSQLHEAVKKLNYSCIAMGSDIAILRSGFQKIIESF